MIKQDKQIPYNWAEIVPFFFLWRMKEVNALRGMDVYIIDQLMKGKVTASSIILDAGCGAGRNIEYLIEQGNPVFGIDSNPDAIHGLRARHPTQKERFEVSSIEDYSSNQRFDFIICNAVLHFAENHAHFWKMFGALVDHLAPNGTLFIRMTSNIGLNLNYSENGVSLLPDGSTRYLISREQVTEMCNRFDVQLAEPVKTVKVEELRSMTTLVFTKEG